MGTKFWNKGLSSLQGTRYLQQGLRYLLFFLTSLKIDRVADTPKTKWQRRGGEEREGVTERVEWNGRRGMAEESAVVGRRSE